MTELLIKGQTCGERRQSLRERKVRLAKKANKERVGVNLKEEGKEKGEMVNNGGGEREGERTKGWRKCED